MCADTSSVLYEDMSISLYEETFSHLYSDAKEATKDTSLQGAIPARELTPAQKELMVVSTGPAICSKETENIKASIKESPKFEKVKQESSTRRKPNYLPYALGITHL